MLGRDYSGQNCSIARALEVVGERWTLLILRDAFLGITRFDGFARKLGIAENVLARRLETLTEAGVLERRPYQGRRYDYVLTERGRELWPVVHQLMQWGERHLVDGGAVRLFSHAACGTGLDAVGTCPACGVTPAPADVETRPGPGASRLRQDAVSRALRTPHRLLTPLG